ncbi:MULTISPECIES: hypothetical protein [Roseomonadaceae]|uniref:Uncharacterized protein n=1 Tax=Falsiroseomonas oleicola TaxID=2801474 RepID=A0ABS6H7Y8_9PROT|nr:hypothetical protein [Roseomonas oleicola]MBU8544815.1 hypothetical protein [Roseomonas oleicola]
MWTWSVFSLTAAPPQTAVMPRPLTRLVGRDADLERLAAQLREARLVTVVGAGGVGKTRLALATADRAACRAEEGVWLADLGPLEDPRLVGTTIATALGLDTGGGDALRTVMACLGSRRGLLVLDGCEHLLRAAADAAEAILRSCPWPRARSARGSCRDTARRRSAGRRTALDRRHACGPARHNHTLLAGSASCLAGAAGVAGRIDQDRQLDPAFRAGVRLN